MIRYCVSVVVLALTSTVYAAIPPLKVTPLGTPTAEVKGTFYRNVDSEPETFNPMNAQDLYSRYAYEYVTEGLLNINPDTYEIEPGLAENYEVSKDHLIYTFFLNPKAHWSDGKPVTAEDVKFSMEYPRNPAYGAAHRMPYYEDVKSVDIVDPKTVRVTMKKKYFKNLEVLATKGFTPILPKHVYEDPKKKFTGAPIFGSGPYKVEAYNRGKNIVLVRDASYWAANEPWSKNWGKFERINFRFIKEDNLQLEMMKKAQIDYIQPPVRPEVFEKKAVGEPFGTTIKKVQAENKKPKSYGFVGWNHKSPLFADRDTRLALSHLLNRPMLMEKFMYGKVVEGRGPVYYKSDFMPADVKPIEFNPEKARKILTKAGWADKDKNGILERTVNGETKEFRFDLLLPNRDVEKYFTLYKEDLKKAGIEMNIKLIEWNAFTKILDEQKFDAVTMAWGGGSPEDDLKQIWHSESARSGGSNFVSYKNTDVDKYIDQAREEMDKAKRAKLWQKAVRQIAEDVPYTFLFNSKYDLFLVNSRIGMEKPSYTYEISYPYWFVIQ